MGAKEICLTVTHEGGFALWPSNFTNYSVARSHWRSGGGDGDPTNFSAGFGCVAQR